MNVEWSSKPALECRWLARRLRHLPVPDVVYVDSLKVGGFYHPPTEDPIFHRGVVAPPARNGLIVVGVHYDDVDPSTLAHEFRHHWQYHNGIEFDHIPLNSDVEGDQWWDHIYDYFTKSKTENDALMFEYRVAKNWSNEMIVAYINGDPLH